MVNIAMLMATAADQNVIPHLTAASAAGVTPVSFFKSLEGSIDTKLGKTAMPEAVSAGVVGTHSSALRIGMIKVEGSAPAGGTMPAEAKDRHHDMQLGLSEDHETSEEEIVAAGSENLIHLGPAVAAENVPSNPKILPAQRPDAANSITSGQERRSDVSAGSRARDLKTETGAKTKTANGRDEVSPDSPAVSGESASINSLLDPFAPCLAGQPVESVVGVEVSSSVVQPVRDSKDKVEIQNASGMKGTAGGAKKRFDSLKAAALPNEKHAVARVEERSGKTTLVNDGSRNRGFNADDSSGFSMHETSASPNQGIFKQHQSPTGELQVIAPAPLMKDQAHMLIGSSASTEVFVSGNSRAGMRGESGMFEQPVAPAGEHRTLAASPTMLEVGVPGGSHGWLKIRAELTDDGAVNASVSSSSMAGAEMLRREIPLLTTYLHQEQVALGSLVVHASVGTQDPLGMSNGFGLGAGGQQHADAQQGLNQQSPHGEWNERPCADGVEGDGIVAWLPQMMSEGGGWLSVRA